MKQNYLAISFNKAESNNAIELRSGAKFLSLTFNVYSRKQGLKNMFISGLHKGPTDRQHRLYKNWALVVQHVHQSVPDNKGWNHVNTTSIATCTDQYDYNGYIPNYLKSFPNKQSFFSLFKQLLTDFSLFTPLYNFPKHKCHSPKIHQSSKFSRALPLAHDHHSIALKAWKVDPPQQYACKIVNNFTLVTCSLRYHFQAWSNHPS